MDSYHELVSHRVIKPFLQRVFTLEDVLTNSFVQSRSPSGSLYVAKKLELSRLEKGIFKFKLLCTDTQRLIVVLVSKSLSSDRGLTKMEVGYVITPCKFLLARCSANKAPNDNQSDLTVCLYLTKLDIIHSPCIPVNLFGQRSIFHHLTHTLLTCDPLLRSSEVDKLVNLSSPSYLSFDPTVLTERELDFVVTDNQITMATASAACKTFNIDTTANTGATIHCDDEIDESSLQMRPSRQKRSRILEANHMGRSNTHIVDETSSLRKPLGSKNSTQTKQVNFQVNKNSGTIPENTGLPLSGNADVLEIGSECGCNEKPVDDDCIYLGTCSDHGIIYKVRSKEPSDNPEKVSDEIAISSNELMGSNFAMALPPNKTRDSLEAELSGNARSSSERPWGSLDSCDRKSSPVKAKNQNPVSDPTHLSDKAAENMEFFENVVGIKVSEVCTQTKVVLEKLDEGKVSKHRAPYDRAKAAKRLKSLLNSSEDCQKLFCCVDIPSS